MENYAFISRTINGRSYCGYLWVFQSIYLLVFSLVAINLEKHVFAQAPRAEVSPNQAQVRAPQRTVPTQQKPQPVLQNATVLKGLETNSTQTDQITYVYDGDGNIVAKTVNGVTTKYLVDDLNPTGLPQVAEEIESGEVTKQYTYGQDLISQRQQLEGNWAIHFYGYDGHGSVRYLTDRIGARTDFYDYDGFGNLIGQIGITPNLYLYSGERWDPMLRLYFNRARYLNVRTGRFWSMDSFEGIIDNPFTLHKYLYADNNPLNKVDPLGLYSIVEGLSFGNTFGVIGAISQPGGGNIRPGSIELCGQHYNVVPAKLDEGKLRSAILEFFSVQTLSIRYPTRDNIDGKFIGSPQGLPFGNPPIIPPTNFTVTTDWKTYDHVGLQAQYNNTTTGPSIGELDGLASILDPYTNFIATDVDRTPNEIRAKGVYVHELGNSLSFISGRYRSASQSWRRIDAALIGDCKGQGDPDTGAALEEKVFDGHTYSYKGIGYIILPH